VVALSGRDRLVALRDRVTVPADAVTTIEARARREVPAEGLRRPGTSVPGLVRAGVYGAGARRDFWVVWRASVVLVVECRVDADGTAGAGFRRLVLEVDDPAGEAERLRSLLPSGDGQP
jgi:hypothetical protein